jgi:Asp/Glu/hydantoin racemase
MTDSLDFPSPFRHKTHYGVTVGILSVNTRFRRFPGDVGHAGTWPFPVQYRIVPDAVPTRMTQLHEHSLLDGFKAAAQELVQAGVDGIATTCGFLSLYQQALADACRVPVAASALLQVPMVQRLLPAGRRVGILTYDAAALTGDYLTRAGVPADTPVAGMPPDSAFVQAIKTGDDRVPYAVLRDEVLATTQRLLAAHPDVGALVLECTNLPPFSADLYETFGLPVFDAVTMITWFQAGLRPRRYRE